MLYLCPESRLTGGRRSGGKPLPKERANFLGLKEQPKQVVHRPRLDHRTRFPARDRLLGHAELFGQFLLRHIQLTRRCWISCGVSNANLGAQGGDDSIVLRSSEDRAPHLRQVGMTRSGIRIVYGRPSCLTVVV